MLRNADCKSTNTIKVKMKRGNLWRNSHNIIHTLRNRESGFVGRHHNVHFSALPKLSYEQRFYESIVPTLTVQNIHTPYFFMRKFTPDGKMLLSVCSDQRSIVVWTYLGVGNTADLLKNETRECIFSMENDSKSFDIRSKIFELLFRKKFIIHLAIDDYSRFHVHREFSIFFDDGRYVMLVASAVSFSAFDISFYWNYPDLYDNLEIYTYVFYIIDLKTGIITDIRTFPHDYINLSHNHGVAAYGQTIAILSKFRQTVTLLEHREGQLRDIDMDGAFSIRFEEIFETISVDVVPPMSLIKQRILAYMIRDIMTAKYKVQRKYRLKKFYEKYQTVEKMLMEKIQLIDEEHVLIRFEEKPPQISHYPASMYDRDFKFYVFYSLTMDKIVHICEKNSINLLLMLRDYCDQFRNVRSMFTGWAPSSPCNNESFRNSFNKAMRSYAGGVREAASRFNQTVPISTQSYSTSPYLSYSLFAYDDRLISALERPKLSSNVPIRFSKRETHELLFRLHLEQRSDSSSRELVAFLFHPYEPFFISIQKLENGYFVNFHIYNRKSIVGD